MVAAAGNPVELTSRINNETVEKAITALFQWKAKQSETEKPQLLEHDDFFYLSVSLKKIPQSRTNPDKIKLPYQIMRPGSDNSEICLIIDDRERAKLSKDDVKKKIKAENIPIAKVLRLSKLKSNYKPYEAKRKLCDSFDMFFADKAVIPLLPKLLGKCFFTKRKLPVPVDLTHNNWKQQIGKVFRSALLYSRNGTCSVVKVGKVSMKKEEIVKNVVAAVNGIAEVVPKKWGNVRSFHLKLPDSVSLPIYQTVPDLQLKIESGKDVAEKEKKEVEKEKESKGKKASTKKKGRIHEVRYLDSNIGEVFDEAELGNSEDGFSGGEEDTVMDEKVKSAEIDGEKRKKGATRRGSRKSKKVKNELVVNSEVELSGGEDTENEKVGIAEVGGKKRKTGTAAKNSLKKPKKVKNELVVNGEEELGKGEDSENDVMGSGDIGGKKKRKGDAKKSLKKSKKVKNEMVLNSEEEFGEAEDSENDKVASAGSGGKKKTKGDATQSLRRSKRVKKEDGLKQKEETLSENVEEELGTKEKKKKKSAVKKSKRAL
ncbi:hypothetical protein ACFE04_001708 [Oxalis oulophora]